MSRPRYLTQAVAHLRVADPLLRPLIEKVGPCLLRRPAEPFQALVRTVLAQQISTKAAAAIGDRLRERVRRTGLTPKALAKLSDEAYRSCGISAAKSRTIRTLARRVLLGEIDFARLTRASEEAIAGVLLPTPGIGPWSVHMYLMFGLARPDVLPTGDYGIRVAVQRHYGLRLLPAPPEIERIAEPWRPYRTVASWYLWRSL